MWLLAAVQYSAGTKLIFIQSSVRQLHAECSLDNITEWNEVLRQDTDYQIDDKQYS